MHELGMAEALARSLTDYRNAHGGRIVTVRVRIGRLAGIEPAALATAWELARGEALAGCGLETITPPIAHVCEHCGRSVESSGWIIDCPYCGEAKLRRRNGQEFLIESIEVE